MIPIFIEVTLHGYINEELEGDKLFIDIATITALQEAKYDDNTVGTRISFVDKSSTYVCESYERLKDMIEYKIWKTLHQGV